MHRQKGLTLLEVLLIFAIVATIFAVGLRVYRQLSQQAYASELQANVNSLFQAMNQYYQANCRKGLSPTQVSYAIPLTDLTSPNFEVLKNWRPQNPLVNQTQGYLLQFNRLLGDRSVTTQFYSIDPRNPQEPSTPMPIPKKNAVVFWKIQVAVRMQDVDNMDAWRGMLGASCVSSLENNQVLPCGSSADPDKEPSQKDYLVWERLPSYASGAMKSPLWVSNAMVQQFNEQYTNDNFYAFNRNDADWDSQSNYETYLCGG